MNNVCHSSNQTVRQRLRALAWLALAFLAAGTSHAQSVRWEPGDSALGTLLQLVFEDCEPSGEPRLPILANASLSLAGRSTSVNMVNSYVTRSVILSYIVSSRSATPLQIPEFMVDTNKGRLRVAAYNAASPAVTAESIASSRFLPERPSVWAGEVFGLTYQLTAASRNNPQFNPTFEWNAAPLVAEEWSKPELTESVTDGQRQARLTYTTRAVARAAGSVKLEPATHLIQIQTGATGFGIFSQARVEPVSVTSDQPSIDVRPLPAAPTGFNGAVGQFKLTSKVVPTRANVGEPVTWTLELSGTGNWPDVNGLPSRDVSTEFQVVQPKAKRTPAEGKLFDATLSEDVVLVPTKPGSYTLGPVAFTFFNTKTGAYETARTERTTVTIAEPALTQIGLPSQGAGAAASAGSQAAVDSSAKSKPIGSPAAPAGIPRDPLPGSDPVIAPLSLGAFLIGLLAPVPLLLGLWLALAWRRAARTDPLRPQREAHARLTALLSEMRSVPVSAPADSSRLSPLAARLLAWQHDSALLWKLSHAAPAPAALPDAAWATLWREADRALYGPDATLPADWVDRAGAALAAKRVPGFSPARLFLPRNLLPFAAVVTLLLLAPAPRLSAAAAAASPDTSYRSGDFDAAEQAWRAMIAQHPTDWVGRHNLSLALAQQDRPGEALAHATAAFVQHPRNASVRWHFAHLAEKAGFAPAPLLHFLKQGPGASLAGLASPAVWQLIMITAAFCFAGGLGWLLVNAYGRRERIQRWAAVTLASLALVAGITAAYGVYAYGETADARSVIVWQPGVLRSIPTEADTTQKTTALSAGSIAIVDKTFPVGWHHLVFANGQTGWVRQETVIFLWK